MNTSSIPIACFASFQPLRTRCFSRPYTSARCVTPMSTIPKMSEEHFDVIRENDGKLLGYSKRRSQVHRDGDWHRSTHIWVFSQKGEVLVQLRAPGKDTFPGRWDVSAAGHITAGDTSLPSACRELEEELGIALKEGEQLELVASVKASAAGSTKKHGAYLDNEIQDVYLYRPMETFERENMVLQQEEVEKVEYWDWEHYRELSMKEDESLVPRSPMYKEIVFPHFDKIISSASVN